MEQNFHIQDHLSPTQGVKYVRAQLYDFALTKNISQFEWFYMLVRYSIIPMVSKVMNDLLLVLKVALKA